MTPLGALQASAFGRAMREVAWLFPAVKAAHLAGVALLFGSIAWLDLRLLGIFESRSVKELARRLLPWTAASFLLIVPSGFAMFAAYAGDFIASPVFAVKMGLILAAGVNAALFHTGASRERVAGGVSLLLWISVIACGLVLASSES